MHIASDRKRDEFEISVVPLIDVLLTLLMFFVLTTTFVRHSRMQVTLPKASADTATAQLHPLVVVIDREGHFYVGSNQVLGSGVDALKRAIGSVAGSERDQPVTLRADAMTPHQAVVTAMDALGQLGFTRLSIATTPDQGSDSQ
ncbi:ExbD/TolR family protein [Oleiagrimonas soli]|uniref:Biopolymer transport protein ExbD n=1 Tax=Oleiagrimonas soli TaxID=1543381 RepID=A0A099CW14_9GAMM|nr:biopolymer transporter ExbD [Oleiagrimonas soli]KGI78138.1 biopolymer transporter [Oleiagrimonas soli]MBB6183412.1 biopolymer transport protein ExbD [Oleiagrimonas soli]